MGAEPPSFSRVVVADVIALDQPFLWNRLGASEPGGMIFALKGDVVSTSSGKGLEPGGVMLRPGKRPRPLVLRMNAGDCLQINFTNLLARSPVNGSAPTRYAGVHINGLELLPPSQGVNGIESDASWVGKNRSSLAAPGETRTYRFHAGTGTEGTFLLYSSADNVDDQGPGSPAPIQSGMGLFGAVNVQPEWAEWYRSQVMHDDLKAATLRESRANLPPVMAVGTASRQLNTSRLMTIEPQLTATGGPRTLRLGQRDYPLALLRTQVPDKKFTRQSEVVVVDGLVYTQKLQPLINYQALYESGPRRGMPVLKMLQAVREQLLFTTQAPAFTGQDVDDTIRAFDSSDNLIPDKLRELFPNANGLSPKARVSIDVENSWLITDPGRGVYLVERKSGPERFEVSTASLHLIHTDLTAIITGPNADRFGYDLESPSFFSNPVLPDRRQPYREYTIIYHQATSPVQAFPQSSNKNTQSTFGAGNDNFAINYGAAGIGSEILANRMGVGPMGNADAVDLKYEEFFLSSWAVGDPAMVVDVPANAQNQVVANPDEGLKVSQQPVFTLDVTFTPTTTNPLDPVTTNLNNGVVVGQLKDAFTAHGITLPANTIASTISPGSQWIALDPFDANQPPSADRGRYPILNVAQRTVGQEVHITFAVYKGMPINPNALSFNGLAKVKATKAFYPDDPSNVYHSYIRDHVKFRILHAGPGPSHVHHLHAHQWLHSPRSTRAQYLDSQLIVPGSAYTLDIVHDGSGNRNLTVGDSIFHCHFYPHFAQGMWSLWRTHDVFELGTWLDADGRPVTLATGPEGSERPVYRRERNGQVEYVAYDPRNNLQPVTDVHAAWNRALPDGEIEAGTPIPAIVPLPSIAMPLLPARVRLTNLDPVLTQGDKGQGRRVEVEPMNAASIAAARSSGRPEPLPDYDNPGYPFFIPGIAGHRAPHPPMDFARSKDINNNEIELNGGLPRHVVLGGKIVKEYHTRWDFTRDFIAYNPTTKQPAAGKLAALGLPEEGTPVEQAAMRHHSTRTHQSSLPNGQEGNITRNGLKAKPGAPYAPPEVNEYGNADIVPRRYKAAVVQTDVVQNKLGWHFPQQRFLTLWEDVAPTIGGQRAPQPLFFRSNTDDTIEYWHTNLVPSYYELDDFQVRTPTDVIGQHIHNVKFDVTSSDGGANGFNYEDGTFSPQEVRDRINAIMRPDPSLGPVAGKAGLLKLDAQTEFVKPNPATKDLAIIPVRDAYPSRPGVGDPQNGLFGKPPEGQDWDGAQTTIQRWDADPLLDDLGMERTLRTIFTHDHLGPSTHQQVGLYAGLVVEPDKSQWYLPDGDRMNTRDDGGPTSWEGFVRTKDIQKSYREFVLEFQDTQLAYQKTSISAPSNAGFDLAKSGTNAAAAFDVSQYDALYQKQIPVYVAQLDKKIIPTALTNVIFPAMGISLGKGAAVTVVTPSVQWQIQEPATADLNAGASYALVANPAQDSLKVYTPGIAPGWSDPPNALQPPPADPNNASNRGPFPQLVSSGLVGTYSMNYRNESVLARVAPTSNGGPAPPNVSPNAGDLGFVFNSLVRADDALNHQPVPGTPINAPPAPVAATTEIDGLILNGTPTWVVGATTKALGVVVKPGDTVVWKAVAAQHGPVFPTQAEAEAVLTFQSGGGLPALGPLTVQGQAVWGVSPQPAGTVLAKATVKPGVAPGTTLTFFCSQHGPMMNGSIATPAAVTPPPATTEIDGLILNGTPTWVVGATTKALGVVVKPGDTVVWKAVAAQHGPVFPTQAEAEAVLTFQSGGGLPALGPLTVQGQAVWGVSPQPAGTVLAKATVKPGVAPGTTLTFFCSQHGPMMNGSIATPAAVTPPPATTEIDGLILNGTPTWVVGATTKALGVVVKPGDTVVWKAVAAQHGPVFPTQAEAEAVLTFQSGGGLPALGPLTVQGQAVWGVSPQPAGTVLAKATVKPGVAPGTTLTFFCSQHGPMMNGSIATPAVKSFKFPAYLVPPSLLGPGGVEQTDPFTPLMRAYANDNVQVRVLVGAHTQPHSMQIQGVRWEFEPLYYESGFKNAQAMGISEHFEMDFKLPPSGADHKSSKMLSFADYLVSPSSSIDGLANGTWSIMRAFNEQVGSDPAVKTYLKPLPNNPPGELASKNQLLKDRLEAIRQKFKALEAGPQPLPAGWKSFHITATTVKKAVPGGVLSFNPRFSKSGNPDGSTYDLNNALLFVRDEDLDKGRLRPDAPREPLILRVAAGDWVEINLTNLLDDDTGDPAFAHHGNFASASPYGTSLPSVKLTATSQAGLHPALVGFDVTQSNGVNVGFNPQSSVSPPGAGGPNVGKFYWYAGDLVVEPVRDEVGRVIRHRIAEVPIEYGATNLVPTDLMVQPQFAMVGALIVEPKGSTWVEDVGTRATATVTTDEDRTFRDFVAVAQNLVANSTAEPTRPDQTTFIPWGAINFRTETFQSRLVTDPANDPNLAAPDSRATAEAVLQFQFDPNLPTLKPRPVTGVQGYVWGSAPQPPVAILAKTTVKPGVAAGTTLDFFCSQHGLAMSGSLLVQAAGGAPATIQIDGELPNGVPTWISGGNPAVKVAVKPGDTVVWRAVAGQHGIVFNPTPMGVGYSRAFSNDQLIPAQDPETPIFRAAAGRPMRFRLVMPSTSTNNSLVPPVTFDIHGHGWQEEPFDEFGRKIGFNVRSQLFGAQQVAPYEAFNFVIDRAGGRAGVPGDYLYEALQRTRILGLWGILRVEGDLVVINEAALANGRLTLKGSHQPSAENAGKPYSIEVAADPNFKVTAAVSKNSWSFDGALPGSGPVEVTVTSSLGGRAAVRLPLGSEKPALVSKPDPPKSAKADAHQPTGTRATAQPGGHR